MSSFGGNVFGVVLLVATFVLPVLFHDIRRRKRLLFCIFIVLLAHQGVAVYNVTVQPIIQLDSYSFHKMASLCANDDSGVADFAYYKGFKFYTFLLCKVYTVFGPSLLLGDEISILLFTLSIVLFVRLIFLIGYTEYVVPMVLLYGLLPELVIFTSITMRESYILLTFIAAVYYALKYDETRRIYYIPVLLIAGFALAMIHRAMMIYVPIMIITLFLFSARRFIVFSNSVFLRKKFVICLCILIAISAGAFSSGLTKHMPVLDYLDTYKHDRMRQERFADRATYSTNVDLSSPITAVRTIATIYANYMFMPFMWQITCSKDIYAFFSVLIRTTLLLLFIYALVKAPFRKRRILGLFLVLYFAQSALWSLGTANYGTAIRHHITHYWLLVLGGGHFVFNKTLRVSCEHRDPHII